jgi:hypothetical protein
MTFDQAAAAIEAAGQQDAVESQPQPMPTPAPDQASAPPTPPDEPVAAEEQPDDAFTGTSEDSFMGEGFNPDLLPDELQPGLKQLQGRWTQRMQEVAEQRKELEALGDVDSLKQAAEFYQSLQDPEYLRAFYGELKDIVGELDGPTPEGEVEPPEQPPAPTELPQELSSLVEQDPELKPVADAMAAMRAELDQFRAEQQQEREALQEEAQTLAQAQEISRQVDVVREAHPDWSDEDWEVVYDLADAREGNVLQAADIFQAQYDRNIAHWTAAKETPHGVTPTPGAGTVTEAAEHDGPTTLREADDAAQAFLDANDLVEFTG